MNFNVLLQMIESCILFHTNTALKLLLFVCFHVTTQRTL